MAQLAPGHQLENAMKYRSYVVRSRNNTTNLDADEFLADAEAQLASTNNFQGLNDRDEIVFVQGALAQGSVRKKAWDMLRKTFRNARDSRCRPDLSYAQPAETLRSIDCDNEVQRKLRKKQVLGHSSQEMTSALAFHVRFAELIFEMEGCGPTSLGSADFLPLAFAN